MAQGKLKVKTKAPVNNKKANKKGSAFSKRKSKYFLSLHFASQFRSYLPNHRRWCQHEKVYDRIVFYDPSFIKLFDLHLNL